MLPNAGQTTLASQPNMVTSRDLAAYSQRKPSRLLDLKIHQKHVEIVAIGDCSSLDTKDENDWSPFENGCNTAYSPRRGVNNTRGCASKRINTA